MKPSERIKKVRDWLVDQERHLTHDWDAQSKSHFKAQLVELTEAFEEADVNEAAVHATWEFFTGQWEPDDCDRAKFTADLTELVGEENPNA